MIGHYPLGTVRAVLETTLLTRPTAAALRARLLSADPAAVPRGSAAFVLLTAICDRLIPQSDRAEPIDIAASVWRAMTEGPGDGWRYAALPPDATLLPTLLTAIDDTARQTSGCGFVELGDAVSDGVLRAVAGGDVAGDGWRGLDARRGFEELLAAAVDAYYAHPLAQEEIGYLGMADAEGWADVGLGARAPFEPVEGGA